MIPGYPQIGDVIADKYRIERRLGGGGMGTVFSATHLMTGRRFALKWMNTRAAYDNAARERFIREFQAAGSIMHPNVAAVLDVGSREGALYIVMEYLEGESLAARIARGGPMTPADCVPIIVEAMRGVAAAHRIDIVHRDLKPDNIFICAGPGRSGYDVKVLDFGVMKPVNERAEQMPTITARGMAVGTPPYMAPEQVLALPSMDHHIDIYAFGVILYEALSARLPYADVKGMQLLERIVRGGPPPLSRVATGVPIGLEATVMRALQKEPRRRFASLEDFAACLQPWAASASSFADLPRRDARTTTPPAGSVAPNDAGGSRTSVPDAQWARAARSATPPPLPARRAVTSEAALVPERVSIPTPAPPPAVAAVFRLSKLPPLKPHDRVTPSEPKRAANAESVQTPRPEVSSAAEAPNEAQVAAVAAEMPVAFNTPWPDLRPAPTASLHEQLALDSTAVPTQETREASEHAAASADQVAPPESGRAASGEFVNGQRSSAEPSPSSGTSSRIPRRSRVATLTPSVAPPVPMLPPVSLPATQQPAEARIFSAAEARSMGSPPWVHPRAVAGVEAPSLSMDALTDALDGDGAGLEGVPFADRVTQPIRVPGSQLLALNVEAAPQALPPSAAGRNWQNGPSQDIWSIPTEFMQAPTRAPAIRSRTILTLVVVAAAVALSIASTQWNHADSSEDAEIDQSIFAEPGTASDDSPFASANEAEVPVADQLAPTRDIFAPSPDDPAPDVFEPSHNAAHPSADIFAPSHDAVSPTAEAIAPSPVPTPALEGAELEPATKALAADSAQEPSAPSTQEPSAAQPSTAVGSGRASEAPATVRAAEPLPPASTSNAPSPLEHADGALEPGRTVGSLPATGASKAPAMRPAALARTPAAEADLPVAAREEPMKASTPAGARSTHAPDARRTNVHPDSARDALVSIAKTASRSAPPQASPAPDGAAIKAASSDSKGDVHAAATAPKAEPAPAPLALAKPQPTVQVSPLELGPAPIQPPLAPIDDSSTATLSPLSLTPATATIAGPATPPNLETGRAQLGPAGTPPALPAAAGAEATRVGPTAGATENPVRSDAAPEAPAPSDSARVESGRGDSAHADPSPSPATPGRAQAERSAAAAAARGTAAPPRPDAATEAPAPRTTPDATRSGPARANSASSDPSIATRVNSDVNSGSAGSDAPPRDAAPSPSSATPPSAEEEPSSAAAVLATAAPLRAATDAPDPQGAQEPARAEPPRANSHSDSDVDATKTSAASDSARSTASVASAATSAPATSAPATSAPATSDASRSEPSPAAPAAHPSDAARSQSASSERAPAPRASGPRSDDAPSQSANSEASSTPAARARSEATGSQSARSESGPTSRARDASNFRKAAPAPLKTHAAGATKLSPEPVAGTPKNVARANSEPARKAPAASASTNTTRAKTDPARPSKGPAVTREAPPVPDSPAAISGRDAAPNNATPARKTSGVSLTDF